MSTQTSPARALELVPGTDEVLRLAALHEYGVLDVPADAEIDDVVRAAALVAGVPHATLNLIDENRQCQLSTVGFEGVDSPRGDSMCAVHFVAGEVVHVRDASLDDRYRTNPWVDGRLARVRLYASAPLMSPSGHAVGTLCVFDTVPGELSAASLEALEGLARVVTALFERRRRARLAERLAVEAREHAAEAERLAARDAELRLVLAATSDAFVAVEEDQVITSWNGAAETLFGWSAEEAVGRTLAETILPPATAAAQDTGFRRLVDTGDRRRGTGVEVTARRRDGAELVVALTLTPVEVEGRARMHAAIRDITERRRLEQQARSMVGIIAGSRDAILSLDATGRITSWNAAAEQLYGFPADQAIGLDLSHIASPDDVLRLGAWFTRAAAGEETAPLDAIETVGFHRDGRRLDVSVTVSPVLDADGVVVGASIAARDVADRRRTETALREAEQRFRLAFDTAPVGMMIIGLAGDRAGAILQVNSTLCSFTGLDAEELVRRDVHDLVHPDERADTLLALAPLVLGEVEHGQVEARYEHTDGSTRWGLLTATAMTASSPSSDGTGERSEPQLLCLIEDTTARRAAEQALRHRALHDGLTGLPNRTLLHDRLEHALAAAGRRGTGVGVLFCDLDGFKAVNDSAGHGAGDELLREVAVRFGACLRPGDTLARLGGDEFGVVCPDVTGPGDLQVIARRLLDSVRAPVVLRAGTFTVGVSIGTHLAGTGAVTGNGNGNGAGAGGAGGAGPGAGAPSAAERALAHADAAMYEAKRAGKNRVHAQDGAPAAPPPGGAPRRA